MSKTYTQCSPEIHKTARDIMHTHHPDLFANEPSFLCIFVDAGIDEEGNPKPAIKHQGYPCAGIVKLTNAADRACGKPDFVIQLDHQVWSRTEEEGRTSLLDHEITHVEPDLDEEGEYQVHSDGRPRLKMRRHDIEIGIFHEVIERHGAAAIDAVQVMNVYHSESGQAVFAFMEDLKTAGKKKRKAA